MARMSIVDCKPLLFDQVGALEHFIPEKKSTTWTHVRNKFKFISEKSIMTTFKSFEKYKTPGPDGIRPVMLQNLGAVTIKKVEKIFKIAMELGHVPLPWKMSGITFIKKPGKKDRSNVRSYRPITLSPFLFKSLEKLMIQKLNTGHLRNNPLHPMQHAFRKGYSCDSALLDAVDFIESGIKRKTMF